MDVFNKVYRPLLAREKETIDEIKKQAEELYKLFDKPVAGVDKSREMALAKTNLEQAVMWAVKGISK
jgi:hypothetical protein